MEQAIEYAYQIQDGSCDMVDIRIYLVKLLHENSQNNKAIEKLQEVIPLLVSAYDKKAVDSLITAYTQPALRIED